MKQDVPQRANAWTSRGLLFLTWNTICFYFLFDAWLKTSEADHEMFIFYFQPYLPIICMVWLWGVNIMIFEAQRVPYEHLFGDNQFLLTSHELFKIATVFSTLFLTGSTVFLTALKFELQRVALWVPFSFLTVCLFVWLIPVSRFHQRSRIHFCKTFVRVLFPVFSVTFSDFLLADICTSLARSIADWVRGICVFSMTVDASNQDAIEFTCGRRSLIINFALAFPYLIRMIQCLTTFIRDHDRVQLFNALKYFTAFPVVFSSMMKHRVSSNDWIVIWNRVWILASILNTGYSYYWDLEMDWDIFQQIRNDKRSSTSTRIKPLYSPHWIYSFALMTNLIIRVAWIYKLSLHLHYIQGIHLLVALLEVYRRSQWILFRFENGLRKTGRIV
eukprot:g6312.t1